MGGASGIEAAQFQQQEEALAMAGEYSRSYDTLRSIGKGAFGFVHMAHRKVDGAIVSVQNFVSAPAPFIPHPLFIFSLPPSLPPSPPCPHTHTTIVLFPCEQVVVKFLRKSSVLKDCWVKDTQMGTVPLEICLLARLSHPNIVQV